MNTRLWLPLAAALLTSAAIAQTTTPPAGDSAPAQPAPAQPTPAQPAPPMSQPATPPAAPSTATAPTKSEPATTGSIDANAPLAGANSFTEAQARARIEAKGFSTVTALQKDNDGIWRGKAMQGDKQVDVALDYRGNVVSR